MPNNNRKSSPYYYREQVKCNGCGKVFSKYPYLVSPTNYCSLNCYHSSTKTKQTRECQICGKDFVASGTQIRQGFGLYCSRECQNKINVDNRIKIVCVQCGKTIYRSPAVAKHTKYCSKYCSDLGMSEFEVHICAQCTKEFKIPLWEVKKGKGKFCSRECFIKFKGESSLEQKVREWLDAHHIKYEQEKRFGKYRADFCLEDRKLIIECDGEFWHLNKKAEIRDHEKDNILKSQGYKVIRLSGTQIMTNLNQIKNLLALYQ